MASGAVVRPGKRVRQGRCVRYVSWLCALLACGGTSRLQVAAQEPQAECSAPLEKVVQDERQLMSAKVSVGHFRAVRCLDYSLIFVKRKQN